MTAAAAPLSRGFDPVVDQHKRVFGRLMVEDQATAQSLVEEMMEPLTSHAPTTALMALVVAVRATVEEIAFRQDDFMLAKRAVVEVVSNLLQSFAEEPQP